MAAASRAKKIRSKVEGQGQISVRKVMVTALLVKNAAGVGVQVDTTAHSSLLNFKIWRDKYI